MNRRELLKLLLTGAAGLTLDVDKLLWVPGQKKIFIPSQRDLYYSQIVSAEYERIIPYIKSLFDRDDVFYRSLNRKVDLISSRDMRVSLIVKPGEKNG